MLYLGPNEATELKKSKIIFISLQVTVPFTPNKMVMLQYDEVFFRLTTPAALPTFAGAESLQKPHHIS